MTDTSTCCTGNTCTRTPPVCALKDLATPIDSPPEAQSEEAIRAENTHVVYFQVTARDAVLVATAQPITKDLADSVAHTAAIHSKSFAKRRLALLDPRTELDKKQICYRYHDRSLIARLCTTRTALQQQ